MWVSHRQISKAPFAELGGTIDARLCLPGLALNLGAGIVHSESYDGVESTIVSANFSQQLPYNISFQASGYGDLSNRDSLGASIGFTMPLGENYNGSTGLSLYKDYAEVTTSVAKPANKPGSYGWRVAYGDGEHRTRSLRRIISPERTT